MSVTALTERVAAASPRSKARTAGAFWLMNAVAGTLMVVWSGVSVILVASASYLGATLFVYLLLKPVNRNLSLIAALFSCVGVSIGTVSNILHLGLMRFEFLFYGLHCFFIGYLILNSTFMPRILGAMMTAAGMSWLTFSFMNLLLAPQVAGSLSPYAMGLGILGEMILTVWLLVAGVHEQRWMEQAGLQGRGS